MTIRKTVSAFAAALVCALLALPAAAQQQTLFERLDADPRFETLMVAIKTAELQDTLTDKGPFTLFAPTDLAWAKIDDATLAGIFARKDRTAALVLDHVVRGRLAKPALAGKQLRLETLGGHEILIDAMGETVTVDGASVTATDILAENGIAHGIDTVLAR